MTSLTTRFLCFLVASVLACLCSGCGDANRAKIIGTWEIERADTLMSRIDRSDAELVEQVDDEAQPPEEPKMQIRFLRSGILETSTKMGAVNQDKRGTWTMTQFDEAAHLMTLDCVIRQQKTEHQIEFLDSSTIKLVPPNMAGTTSRLKFKRTE